jgi:DNA polymerase IV (archaeal DinB-like DNA polymerase)
VLIFSPPKISIIFILSSGSACSKSKTNNAERHITFRVDMGNFFASVEVRERSELKGLSVVVGSDPKGGAGRVVIQTGSHR